MVVTRVVHEKKEGRGGGKNWHPRRFTRFSTLEGMDGLRVSSTLKGRSNEYCAHIHEGTLCAFRDAGPIVADGSLKMSPLLMFSAARN